MTKALYGCAVADPPSKLAPKLRSASVTAGWGHQRKQRAPEAYSNLYTPSHPADIDQAIAYERINGMRRTAINVRGAADKIA